MRVSLNGLNKEFTSGINLDKIIEPISHNNSRIIAEVNGRIVKSTDWAQTVIGEGDLIELVSFVGGG